MPDTGVTWSKLALPRTIEVRGGDSSPLTNVHVARLASNGTYFSGVTDADGRWSYEEVFLGTVTVLAAGDGWSGAYTVLEDSDWTSPLVLTVDRLSDGGSAIFEQDSGHLPILNGRLNPIRDSLGRAYIYGDNLSFNDSPNQPFGLEPGVPFSVADARGNVAEVTILTILGRTSLLRYQRKRTSPL